MAKKDKFIFENLADREAKRIYEKLGQTASLHPKVCPPAPGSSSEPPTEADTDTPACPFQRWAPAVPWR